MATVCPSRWRRIARAFTAVCATEGVYNLERGADFFNGNRRFFALAIYSDRVYHSPPGCARGGGLGDRSELEAEQARVDFIYERIGERIRRAQDVAPGRVGSAPWSVLEADERAAISARRVAELELGDLPVCFGRIDERRGDRWYVGRLGVDDGDGDPLLVDWRAPVAAPFYRATSAEPMGLAFRRHIHCRGRAVVALDDDLMDAGDTDAGIAGHSVVGEAALLRALTRHRTGRMGDIVATIQSEQDAVIRAPLDELLIVQGGPGTGKTAVALHRVAYLLYTHRATLEAKRVLLIGPSATFLKYIERVLPTLGEHAVTLTTMAALLGSEAVTATEDATTAALKGDIRMASLLANAVKGRERRLAKDTVVPVGAFQLAVTSSASRKIVDRARATAGPHNRRRGIVERRVLKYLHRRHEQAVDRARRAGRAAQDTPPFEELAESLAGSRALRGVLDRMWPVLTPEQLLRDLFGSEALLAEAARGVLSSDEQRRLLRHRGATVDDVAWTRADLALLDEAKALLGDSFAKEQRTVSAEDLDWLADRVLEGVRESGAPLSASMAAEIRKRINDEQVGVAEEPRAPSVTRTYGYVVVDEAQELSPMEWRAISRRCPTGHMTVVGDLGQRSGRGAGDWDEVAGHVGHPPHVVELSVNYRTPIEVMELAAAVLESAAPGVSAPSSVRSSGVAPQFFKASGALGAAVARQTKNLVDAVDPGTVAVITADGRRDAVTNALEQDPATVPSEPLAGRISVLTCDEAKGLEFDAVVLVEPAEIAKSDGGLNALYVALTRTTARLSIVYSTYDGLPSALCERSGLVGAD